MHDFFHMENEPQEDNLSAEQKEIATEAILRGWGCGLSDALKFSLELGLFLSSPETIPLVSIVLGFSAVVNGYYCLNSKKPAWQRICNFAELTANLSGGGLFFSGVTTSRKVFQGIAAGLGVFNLLASTGVTIREACETQPCCPEERTLSLQ